MAKKTAPQEYLALRRRYAAVIVRYRALTSILQTAFEDIAYNSGLMKNHTLPALIETTIANRNKAIDDLIVKLADIEYPCDDYEVSKSEYALLWHEARFLTVAEAAQLSTWAVHKDTSVTREEYTKFCYAYLKLNQIFRDRFDAITGSDWFSPRNPYRVHNINACVQVVHQQLEANIQQVKEELKKPKITADEEELMRWAIRLRFTVQRFGEQVLDELDIAKDTTTIPRKRKSKTGGLSEYAVLRKRYAACTVRYRQLAANLTCPRSLRVSYAYMYPTFFESLLTRIANLNRNTDSLIMMLAETDLQLNDSSVETIEQSIFMDEAKLLPVGQVSSLGVEKLYRSIEENPELNRTYCIEHMKLANMLSQYLTILCSNSHVVPAKQEAANDLIGSIATTRAMIDAYIYNATVALNSPVHTVPRSQSENLWHSKLISIIVGFAEDVVTKLTYSASPVTGPSLWEQAGSLTPSYAMNDISYVQPVANGNSVRVLH